jgi:tetratricopeptide (TPR) repeat protein
MNIETSLAQEIAEKLRVRFTVQQQLHAAKSQTESTGAYQFYLKGRYHCNKRNENGLRAAIALFKDALDEDPAFAKAWAGLADCYALLGCWGFDVPHDAYPKAKAAAEKAIAFDDYLAEAHASLAVTRKDYEWDWAGAEREYRRALELNPSYALGHQWYGEYLACVSKHTAAIKELEHARQLDPLSPMITATLGRHGYYFARDLDRACDHLRKVTRSDPDFWVAHLFLGWVLTLMRQCPEAIEQFTIARQLDQNAETLVGLGYAQALAGDVHEARQALAQLKMLRHNSYVQPVSIALIHVGLAEKDEAFAWLDKAYDEHAQWLSEIKADPAFDPLRSDPRFQALYKKMNFPP